MGVQIMETKNEKLWFLQSIRAIATIMVMYSHWGELFWSRPDIAATLSYSVQIDNAKRPFFLFITDRLEFSFGPFGVALFFMVTGYLIVHSLENNRISIFLVKKFLRLYSTYSVTLLLTCGILYISANYWNIPYNISVTDYLKNLSLFRDFYWVQSLDMVNWTMEVQVKFYLLCAFIMYVSKMRNTKTITILIGALTTLSYCVGTIYEYALQQGLLKTYIWMYAIIYAVPFIIFCFIGVVFYYYDSKVWNLKTSICMIIYLIVMYYIAIGIAYPGNMMYPISYYSAFIVFLLIFRFRKHIPRIRVLSFLADISFPVYLIHGVVGFAIMNFLYQYQPYPYLIMLETFVLIILLSYLLHCFIEKPSIKLVNMIAKRIDKCIESKEQ